MLAKGNPGPLPGLMLKGPPNELGRPEPDQHVLIFVHQLSKMTAPLDLALIGPIGVVTVTRCVSVGVCVWGVI